LYPCEDGQSVTAALDEIWERPAGVAEDAERLQTLTWNGQAERLESFFKGVTEEAVCAAS
jgi:hypothetical protein